MYYLLTIMILIIMNTIVSYSQFVEKTHYNTKNLLLKILQIDENKINLYGHDGAVLRSTDAGENWHQNFSGTHSFIYNQKFYKNKIYGITSDNQLMISDDYGDYWEYIKLDFDCRDIAMKNDTIYILSEKSLYFKNINDKEFVEIKFNEINLKNMKLFDNGFVLISENNTFYSFDESNSILEKISSNTNESSILNVSNDLIIYNNFDSFGYINKNQVNTHFENINLQFGIDFVEIINDDIYIFSTNNSDEIYIYEFDKETKKITNLVSSHRISDLKQRVDRYKQIINDIELIDNKLLISIKGKVLLSFDLGTETFTEHFYSPNQYNTNDKLVLNEENILLSDNTNSTFCFSTDGGKIFNKSKNKFIDSVSQVTPVKLNPNHYFHTSNNTLFVSFNDGFLTSFLSKLYYSDDFGLTFDSIPNFMFDEIRFLKEKNGFLYFYNKVGDYPLGSYKFEIIKLNIKTKEYETINSIPLVYAGSMLTHVNIENVDYCMLHKYYDWENKKLESYLIRSVDDFKTFDTLNFFDGYNTGIFKYDDDNLIVRNQYIYNISNNTFDSIKDTTLNTIARIPEQKYDKLKNMILVQYKSTKIDVFAADFENKYVKINLIENKFEVDTLSDAPSGINVLPYVFYSNNDDFYIFNQSTLFFYIPIELERLEYYASSVESGGPPAIWTYPPYPNPVKDKMRMKFYSAMMNEIAKLQIELIEIGSGRSYKIYDYQIMKTSDYWGEIIIDVGKYETGAYLINFKLGDSNKSESIIIE